MHPVSPLLPNRQVSARNPVSLQRAIALLSPPAKKPGFFDRTPADRPKFNKSGHGIYSPQKPGSLFVSDRPRLIFPKTLDKFS